MRVKITKQIVHGKKADSTLIQMEPDLRFRPLCHQCSQPGTIHTSGLHRIIHDLPMANTDIWLQVQYRKIWCYNCQGGRVEQLSFARSSQRVTDRLARYIFSLCKVMTVKDVADHFNLNPKTVKQIDKEYLEETFGFTDTKKSSSADD